MARNRGRGSVWNGGSEIRGTRPKKKKKKIKRLTRGGSVAWETTCQQPASALQLPYKRAAVRFRGVYRKHLPPRPDVAANRRTTAAGRLFRGVIRHRPVTTTTRSLHPSPSPSSSLPQLYTPRPIDVRTRRRSQFPPLLNHSQTTSFFLFSLTII